MKISLCFCTLIAAMAMGACAGANSEQVSSAEAELTTIKSGSVTATLTTTSDWGAGFCDNVTIRNSGAAVTNWTIKLATGGATLSKIWNARQTTSGTTMTVTPSGNANIPTNGSITFGFCGTGTGRPTLSSMTVTGGTAGTGGSSTGGATSTGGSPSTGGSTAIPCSGKPLTGGTVHCGSTSGAVGGYDWSVWSNTSAACLTTYGVGAAFKANWNNSGDSLFRVGLKWDATKTFDQYGTISADYSYTKSGTGGAYSFMGFYGWSNNPCVEYYIVDDSFSMMPFNPGNTTNKGTVDIDGGSYILYTRNTSGTGGSMCPGATSWVQYYSVRKTARQCGHISVTEHFKQWAKLGMPLGRLYEGKLLVETGGGSGSVDYTAATVTAK